MKKSLLAGFIICLSFCSIQGQKSITAHKLTEPINLDGQLNEAIWQTATIAKDFSQYFPTDSVLAIGQSEVQMAYDDKNLYVSVKCYSTGNDWVVSSLKRDYRGSGIDNMTIVLDPFNDKTNANFFGINAEGVIREGVITNGGNGRRDFDTSWDNKWRGESTKHDGYFTAELEIPFSSLRFNTGVKEWNLSLYRFDAQCNEWSTWTGVPRYFMMTNLGYAGKLVWEEPLQSSGSNISLIPYVTAGVSKDYENDSPADPRYQVGGDAKIALTSGLNLDLTVNPDFSQVEVDQQITDLSRFELFFPERRQFFLENADLFGSFGFSAINPFFSRRIGVARNADDDLVENRIYAGARLSGKLNNKLRLGLLNMQTASDKESEIFSTNYSVAALQYKLWTRSNISFIMVNKQLLNADDEIELKPYNRVAGIDFNFADGNNIWFGKTFVHTAFTPNQDLKMSHGLELNYNTRHWFGVWHHEYVQSDYNAEVGFIRRTNYINLESEFGYSTYPKEGPFNQVDYQFEGEFFIRPSFGKTDHTLSLGAQGSTRTNGRFGIEVNHDFVYLFSDFDPTGTDSEKLGSDTEYNYVSLSGYFSSDNRKTVSYFIRPYIGKYFNGFRLGTGGRIRVLKRPKASLEVDFSINHFDMPHLDETKQTFLLGPRIDYTFSKELFFTTFIQYNTQQQNTNINARLQWRFAPVSDFYLVFTDNYFSGSYDPSDRFTFDLRNRAIVAKLTYWFNT